MGMQYQQLQEGIYRQTRTASDRRTKDTKTTICRNRERATNYGFFFLPKRPVRASTALAGVLAPFSPAPRSVPPVQPSWDLSRPAATPPTSGTNFGSEEVPWIRNGIVVPFLPAPLFLAPV